MSSEIDPKADISPRAKVGDGYKVFPFVCIEDDVIIGDNCITFPLVSILNDARMGNGDKIHQGSVLAALPQDFEFVGEKSGLIIGDSNIVQENIVISRATHRGCRTVLNLNNSLMEGTHTSHDTIVDDRYVLGYSARMVDDYNIGTSAPISLNVVKKANTRVGKYTVVQADTIFPKDVPPYIIVGGSPIGYHGINTTVSRIAGVDDKVLGHIANAYRLLSHSQTSVFGACIQIE